MDTRHLARGPVAPTEAVVTLTVTKSSGWCVAILRSLSRLFCSRKSILGSVRLVEYGYEAMNASRVLLKEVLRCMVAHALRDVRRCGGLEDEFLHPLLSRVACLETRCVLVERVSRSSLSDKTNLAGLAFRPVEGTQDKRPARFLP
jgi:hypothetical protein